MMPEEKNLKRFRRAVGRALVNARLNAHYTLRQAAIELNIPEFKIDNLELGKRSLTMERAVKFAKIYKVEVGAFLKHS